MKIWIISGAIIKADSWDKAINESGALLEKSGLEIEVYRRSDIVYTLSGNGKISFFAKGKEVSAPDAFLSYGNIDGAMEGVDNALVAAGAKSVNPANAKRIAESKLKTAILFETAGLPQAKTMVIYKDTPVEKIKEEIGIPLVTKPDGGFGGKGVELIKTEEELQKFLDDMPDKLEDVMLAQEYIGSSKGRDLRVIIINGKYFTSIVRKAGDPDEFRSNVHQGGHYEDFDIDDETIALCEKAAKATGLGICTIDLLFAEEGFLIGEINDSPGIALLVKQKKGAGAFIKALSGTFM